MSLIVSQGVQRASQRQAQLDGQHLRITGLGQVREGLEGLLEIPHRLVQCGTVVGPGTGLLAAGHCLVPHLAPEGMIGQAFDLLGHPCGRQRLDGLDNVPVQQPPPLQQEAAIGYFVRQGMLEGVF